MPKLGHGVYQVSNQECERCVLDAVSTGYRSIDTAQSYGNEEAVGSAVEKCSIPRQQLFLTTKIWISFAEGRKDFFSNPVLTEIGAKYGKSSAQTALRFLLQSDVVVIPKSTHKERMEQNLDVFDFSLEEEDMEAIRALDEGESLFFNHYDPATVEMLTNMGRTRKV